jgi:hypothetical protein
MKKKKRDWQCSCVYEKYEKGIGKTEGKPQKNEGK